MPTVHSDRAGEASEYIAPNGNYYPILKFVEITDICPDQRGYKLIALHYLYIPGCAGLQAVIVKYDGVFDRSVSGHMPINKLDPDRGTDGLSEAYRRRFTLCAEELGLNPQRLLQTVREYGF